MATTTYITDINWIPDPAVINSAQGIHYLAWKIGVDTKNGTATWLIAQVRFDDYESIMTESVYRNALPIMTDYPEDALPNTDDPGTEVINLETDVTALGQVRTAQNKTTIDQLKEAFEIEVLNVMAAVAAGTR